MSGLQHPGNNWRVLTATLRTFFPPSLSWVPATFQQISLLITQFAGALKGPLCATGRAEAWVEDGLGSVERGLAERVGLQPDPPHVTRILAVSGF